MEGRGNMYTNAPSTRKRERTFSHARGRARGIDNQVDNRERSLLSMLVVTGAVGNFPNHSDLWPWTMIDTRMVNAEKEVLPRELQLEGLFKKCNFITVFNAHCNIVFSLCLKYTYFKMLHSPMNIVK